MSTHTYAEERARADNDDVYATQTRQPVHHLIDWGWSRERCLRLLKQKYRITWKKSACSFCPFAGSKASMPALMQCRVA
ncbi:hypothetical protein GCM10009754_28370 [Amycolatopsis minnesotensis]|uniref:Uncharacterized protein n=1 Tax=Amycolatopsis minnesotensis TaxID=337894 RepID=A0ABP5C672_9PSEU